MLQQMAEGKRLNLKRRDDLDSKIHSNKRRKVGDEEEVVSECVVSKQKRRKVI